jgi:hypothetical protein
MPYSFRHSLEINISSCVCWLRGDFTVMQIVPELQKDVVSALDISEDTLDCGTASFSEDQPTTEMECSGL